MTQLTVFTPTYNRSHTLCRTYHSLCRQTCKDFEWLIIDDGSTDNTKKIVENWITDDLIPIKYIYKDNGGLYTGYNVAYQIINSELCVCIDSDDFMPDNAVELILNLWNEHGNDNYAGIIGLDYFLDNTPIGGKFPDGLSEVFLLDLFTKKIHLGDTKQVMRTSLMKSVAPQEGFEGEKNFNPIYMLLQVCDKLPLLVLNENICNVEYQDNDSMSKNIYKQYVDSPRSFAKLRLLEMQLERNTLKNKFRCAIHYVSSCIFARDKMWLKQAPNKLLVILALPLGIILYYYIKNKVK